MKSNGSGEGSQSGRSRRGDVRSVTLKVLGQEYRVRSDEDAQHLEKVAQYVDDMMREIRQGSSADVQTAAIMTALTIASDLLQVRDHPVAVPQERLRALIELVDQA